MDAVLLGQYTPLSATKSSAGKWHVELRSSENTPRLFINEILVRWPRLTFILKCTGHIFQHTFAFDHESPARHYSIVT